MDYIETKPPVSEAIIQEYIEKLASVKTRGIDGIVLSNLVRVCHECALKKGELIELSIKDVAKGGITGDNISIGGNTVALTTTAKQILQDHINYLKANGYAMRPSNPLFPAKDGTRYSAKNLDNHLKKA